MSRHVSAVNQRDDRVAPDKQVVERDRDLITLFHIDRFVQLGIEPIVFVRLEALDVSTVERVGCSSDPVGDSGAKVALRVHAAVGVHLNVGVETAQGVRAVRVTAEEDRWIDIF